MKKYFPVNSQESPRFCGIQTFMRLPYISDLEEDIDVAVIGVPFDTASSYRTGSRFGPSAIRQMSSTIRPYNINMKVTSFEHINIVDNGDINIVPGFIDDTYKAIEKHITNVIDKDIVPVCLGGDHSITLAELRAIAKKHGPVALVHFDSHTDTYDGYFGQPYNHGTPFYHAVKEGLIDTEHSIQVGMRGNLYSEGDLEVSRSLGFELITSEEVHEIGMKKTIERIVNRVQDAKTFLTFDIDFVDPAYAPGTGTLEIGGVTSAQTLELLRGIRSLNYVGFDVVEVSPPYDILELTSNLAANIAHDFICMVALKHKKGD